jgi:solute:Na+ symporter, SSS family
MGRLTNAAAVLLSIGAASLALRHESLMEYVQMILSTFNAPLFALVALAALAPHRVAGGLGGFTLGLLSAVLHQALVYTAVLHYGSQMSANFYAAILGFSVAVFSTLLIGIIRKPIKPLMDTDENAGPVSIRFSSPTVLLAVMVVAACIFINVFFGSRAPGLAIGWPVISHWRRPRGLTNNKPRGKGKLLPRLG